MKFCVTSYGLSASRWISFVLASKNDVFVAHGSYALDSIINGDIKTEKKIGKEKENYDALKKGRELHEFIKGSSLSKLFSEYQRLKPDASVYGNVHSFVPSELFSKNDRELKGLIIVNLLRNPIAFIDCHKVVVLQSRNTDELQEHYKIFFQYQVLPWILSYSEFKYIDFNNHEDIAFLMSCYSIIGQAKDMAHYQLQNFQMEKLTSDVDYLEQFCNQVTGLIYDKTVLNEFIKLGRINNHRKKNSINDPQQIYNGWSDIHKQIFNKVVREPYGNVFIEQGYTMPMST